MVGNQAKMVSYPVFCLPFIILLYVQLGLSQNECVESNCGRGGPIVQFPFKIKDGKLDHCGYPGFDLSCTDEHETVLELPAIPVKFFVRSIDYKSQVLEVYEPNNCFLRQLLGLNFSLSSPFQFQPNLLRNYSIFDCSSSEGNIGYEKSCYIIDTCFQLCAVLSDYDISSFEMPSCTKMGDISASWIPYQRSLFLSWTNPDCSVCEAKGKNCRLKNNGTEGEIECFFIPKPIRGKSAKIIATSVVLGSFLLILVAVAVSHIYRSSKAREEYEVRIEQFLDDYRALKPTRYSFADIKKITNQFKEKLGQGAYGIVFKGRLSNEIHVAVKILNHSRSNGEEFINEVRTMGKIHHVNIVRLVGFCADGLQRALVYEFLPNDSLERFISSPDMKSHFLGWEKLQDIAIGIAKGIEYLHQGCDHQIVHFDIKPHNILLVQNFTPKISDFGMAKLCSKDQSVVSMTAARGTVGYIAPEVFSRNFGKVSYKSDVYSFGVLLLEMVGGKKNVEVTLENDTQIYYPEWIYNLLEGGEDLRIHIEEEKDSEIAKKLAIVGLLCIQWHPVDRPSMKVVVQMLEGDENKLSMPPNPFASTGLVMTNASMRSRLLNQGLEVIQEEE